MADPESAVVTKIATMSAWTKNTNLFRGPLLGDEDYGAVIPRLAVFVRLTGGPPAMAFSGLTKSTQEHDYNVQVILRGNPDVYGSTRTLANAIYDTLHDSTITGYYSVRVVESAPIHMGQDERRSHIFNMNVRLRILD